MNKFSIAKTSHNNILLFRGIDMWDSTEKKMLKSWVAHETGTKQSYFSPSGKKIVTTGSDNKTVRVWDMDGTRLFNIVDEQPINNASPYGYYFIHLAVFDEDDYSLIINYGNSKQNNVHYHKRWLLPTELLTHPTEENHIWYANLIKNIYKIWVKNKPNLQTLLTICLSIIKSIKPFILKRRNKIFLKLSIPSPKDILMLSFPVAIRAKSRM